jgi:hypothetical protein
MKAAILLVGLGCLSMAADLLGFTQLKGLGIASHVSPAPKVFCSQAGLETYSSRFFLEWNDLQGKPHSIQLTPELGSRLRGPYNRRNVYGAIIAYGPVLVQNETAKPMFDGVMSHAFGGDAPLLRELGVDPQQVAGTARIRLAPLAGTDLGDLPLVLEVTR